MKKTHKTKDKASDVSTKPGVSASRQRSGKTPRKIHWIRYGVVFVVLLVSVIIIGNFIYAQNYRETQIRDLATRLNTVVEDIKSVYDEILSTKQNVKISRFENSCGQSSDVVGNGTITCGSYVTILFDNVSDYSEFMRLKGRVHEIVNKKFLYKEEHVMSSDPLGQSFFSSNIVSAKGSNCDSSDSYYVNSLKYNESKNQDIVFSRGGYIWNMSCSEISPDFLPGYSVNK